MDFPFVDLTGVNLSCLSKKTGQKKPSTRGRSALAVRFREDLVLDGKRPRTIDAYVSVIVLLAEYHATPPDQLTEEQVRDFLLRQRKEKALNSIRPILARIKKFYQLTVVRDWRTLNAMRLPRCRKLPRVLTPERVWELIYLHLTRRGDDKARRIVEACFNGPVQADEDQRGGAV